MTQRSSVGSATMRGVGDEPFAKLHDAAIRELLIHHRGEQHVAGRRDALLLQARRRHASSPRGRPWCRRSPGQTFFRPRSRGSKGGMVMPCTDTVSVCASRTRRRDRIPAGQSRETLGRFGKHLLLPHLDAALLEEAPHKRRDLAFARPAFVGRVHAVDAHELGERLNDGRDGHPPESGPAPGSAQAFTPLQQTAAPGPYGLPDLHAFSNSACGGFRPRGWLAGCHAPLCAALTPERTARSFSRRRSGRCSWSAATSATRPRRARSQGRPRAGFARGAAAGRRLRARPRRG